MMALLKMTVVVYLKEQIQYSVGNSIVNDSIAVEHIKAKDNLPTSVSSL